MVHVSPLREGGAQCSCISRAAGEGGKEKNNIVLIVSYLMVRLWIKLIYTDFSNHRVRCEHLDKLHL